MNYVNFMRKLEGKEPHDTTDSTTSGPRPLDLQGIIEFTRGCGYSDDDLEARPEVSDDRAAIFWAGYDGLTWSATMGLYRGNSSCFLWAGRQYQREQGNTHSQQQDSVPVETPRGNGGSDWVVNGDDGVNLDEIRRIYERLARYSVGSPPSSPFTRSEFTGRYTSNACSDVYIRSDEQPLRSPLDSEESRVQSVCNERSSRERSAEDTGQSSRYRMERSQRW
jgi:hypothetical protein